LHPCRNDADPAAWFGVEMVKTFRTTDEERDMGREARRAVPRSTVGGWRPPPDRTDPVALLAEQDRSRVPGLVPVRHARMSVSPFTYFRGAAAVMAADLAAVPTSGFEVQLCGDAHLSNFGSFAGPGRELLFDVNDFDETLRGPWEWDLLRLVTSLVVAGQHRSFSDGDVRDVALAASATYRESMADLASRSPLDVWYARLDTEAVRRAVQRQRKSAVRDIDRGVEAARRRTNLQAARKLAEDVDGRLRFRSDPPVLVPLADVTDVVDPDRLADAVRATFEDFLQTLPDARAFLLRRYRMVDIAHKVVGVGSVGMRALVVLLQGPGGDPLVLQFKEAGASVLEEHLDPSPYPHHGQRVVEGQQMMQAASDIFLGWSTSSLDGRHYYWRQLRDMKGSADIDVMKHRELSFYARMCGWTLARAHARSGSAAAIAAYLGRGSRFDEAAVAFAHRYAALNADDHARHAEAIAEGAFSGRR
jgi:uncharacterized protein (DUF2252 family)